MMSEGVGRGYCIPGEMRNTNEYKFLQATVESNKGQSGQWRIYNTIEIRARGQDLVVYMTLEP